MPKPTATPAQTSANSTACSLKKLPTISVPTPSEGQRRVSSARAGFYHMGLGSGFGARLAAGELERRERPDQLRMDAADVAIHFGQQRVVVLSLQDRPAPAFHHGCHP